MKSDDSFLCSDSMEGKELWHKCRKSFSLDLQTYQRYFIGGKKSKNTHTLDSLMKAKDPKDDDLSDVIIRSISPMRRSDDTDRFISSPSHSHYP